MENQKKQSDSNFSEKEKLSGIERELVLQYLMDGNVPVTLTPINEEKSSSGLPAKAWYSVAPKA